MAPVGTCLPATNTLETATNLGLASKLFHLHPELPTSQIEIVGGKIFLCRPMTTQDYKAVRTFLPKVSRCSEYYSEEVIEQLLSIPTFFPYVLLDNEQVIGFAELHRLPHLGRGFDARLEKVLILEEYRGKKLGQKLCQFLLGVARSHLQCGRVDLTVEKPDAKAVYLNLGFSKVETEVWRIMFN